MPKILFVLILGLSVSPVWAADRTPPKIGAFLAYCKTHGKACGEKIMEINAAMLITQPIGKTWCPGNKTTDEKVVVPRVTKWLAAHRDVHGKATSDGIQLALTQLYPCKP
jgi:hypothetical protein